MVECMDYSLESLEKTFTEHAYRVKEQYERQKREREENGWETPEYEDGFSLPEAFVSIIREIRQLKDK